MEKLKNLIQSFEPSCEQEEKDKDYLLSFISSFNDVLTRENIFGHLSSSAFVLNEDKTKIKPDENKSVIWADINEINKSIKLVDFFVPVFQNFKNKLMK